MSGNNEEYPGDNVGQANLAPTKQIYRSAAVDVDPIDAVEELVDNAIDNWMRESRRVDDISIEIKAEDNYTKVTDDTGGLSKERVKILFALGDSFQQEVQGSIGAYGIGAKKALVRLGEHRLVKSRNRDSDFGVGFEVDEEWMNSDDWAVTLKRYDKMDPGETTLEVKSSEDIWNDHTVDQLRTQLGQTYKLFLAGDVSGAGDLEIILNGNPVEPADDVPWSFTPFDDLHPRRYSNIELRPKSITDPVTMDVTVGLMTAQNSKRAGTDFYCQDRLVTRNEREEVGGYGSVGQNRIGNFTTHNARLKVIVELRTDGDSSELPWDGQKSTIDPHHPVSRMMYNWLRRIVRPYFKADTGKVKKAFVEPYDQESEYAANGGEIEELDYQGREKVMHGPDQSLTDIQTITKIVESHIKEGYKYYRDLPDEFVPAYDAYFESYFPKNHDEKMSLEEVPVKEELDKEERVDTEDEVLSFSEFVENISGAGASKAESLMSEGYADVESIHNASVDELTTVRGIGTSLAQRIKKRAAEHLGEEPEGIGEPESPDDTERGSQTEDDHDDEDTDETTDSGIPDDVDADEEDTEQSEQGSSESTDSQDESEVGENSDQTTDNAAVDSPDEQATLEDAPRDPNKVTLQLDLEKGDYERLCTVYGIDEDDRDKLSETLREKILDLFAPSQT